MSEYPDAGYGDIEKALGELLRPLVAEPEHIGNWPIIDYQQIEDPAEMYGTPMIGITLRGGPIDPDDFTWYVNVEVSCWGKTRSVALGAEAEVRRLVLQSGGEEVAGVLIDAVEDVTGPQWISVQNPDNRGMTRIFQFALRPQY